MENESYLQRIREMENLVSSLRDKHVREGAGKGFVESMPERWCSRLFCTVWWEGGHVVFFVVCLLLRTVEIDGLWLKLRLFDPEVGVV